MKKTKKENGVRRVFSETGTAFVLVCCIYDFFKREKNTITTINDIWSKNYSNHASRDSKRALGHTSPEYESPPVGKGGISPEIHYYSGMHMSITRMYRW